MAIEKTTDNGRKEIRMGMLGCGFMGKCHTNAYKKIPYIYPDAGINPRLLVLCGRDEEKVARSSQIRLRGVLYRLARARRRRTRRCLR